MRLTTSPAFGGSLSILFWMVTACSGTSLSNDHPDGGAASNGSTAVAEASFVGSTDDAAASDDAQPPDDVPATAVEASSDAPANAACTLVAPSYDQSCNVDSDCVLVPPGGDVCAPCSNGTGCLFCSLASVNRQDEAAYRAALHAALAPYTAPQYFGCAFGSCPVGIQAVCDAGMCTTSVGSLVCP